MPRKRGGDGSHALAAYIPATHLLLHNLHSYIQPTLLHTRHFTQLHFQNLPTFIQPTSLHNTRTPTTLHPTYLPYPYTPTYLPYKRHYNPTTVDPNTPTYLPYTPTNPKPHIPALPLQPTLLHTCHNNAMSMLLCGTLLLTTT